MLIEIKLKQVRVLNSGRSILDTRMLHENQFLHIREYSFLDLNMNMTSVTRKLHCNMK